MPLSTPAFSQARGGYGRPSEGSQNSLFLLMGYTRGPYFDDFVNWANKYYAEEIGSTDSISNFKGGFDFSIGLRTRVSRQFALEFDFLTYVTKIQQVFRGQQGQTISQTLELNVAVMTVSGLVLFQFYDTQRIVPFVGTGISVFPVRLDQRIDFWERHTKTALAGNLAAGLEAKLYGKVWGTLRGDWTLGKTSLPVSYPYGQPDHFELNLTTAQLQAGVIYSFQ